MNERRLGRRSLVAGSAALVATGLAGSITVAQSSTPVADPEPDPEPDPTANGQSEFGTGDFTLYSGRSEALVGPLIEMYGRETGSTIDVRYGGTGELAATIQEEGENSPATAFFAQDAGALGLLAEEGRFQHLSEEILSLVDSRYRDPNGFWVGVTGRARVLAYNIDAVMAADLPESVRDLTDPVWTGRIGWAPENASFQSFITAFRLLDGDETVRSWLETMIANGTVNFGDSNTAMVEAIGSAEIDAGLVNHYYVYVVGRKAGPGFPVANHFFASGDPGSLVNVAGIGLLDGAEQSTAALAFVEYMLSPAGQEYFTTETFEYPLALGLDAPQGLVPLSEIDQPDFDLGDLADLRGTLDLLIDVGLL
ncbi:MAG: iron ABC transporter substrate-binding protein [Chloroflexota bacterium]|nr:iron ABC transporter substrate-binding protein [Chloroflexota bacterium]